MKTLETERLILRKFTHEDFAAVHSYASCKGNVIYMLFGPNSEDETKAFINRAISHAEQTPWNQSSYAVVLKSTNTLIGSCDIHRRDNNSAEIGWILHCDYWNQGYGTEMGNELLRLGFEELNLQRIIACCDADNIGSYSLMEKLGMRRDAHFRDCRPAHKQSQRRYGDELHYSILKSDWETVKQIAYYNSLPFKFTGFIDIPTLTNGDIYLVCTEKTPANPEKMRVPAYNFIICKNGEKIGNTGLRIGYGGGPKNDNLYYGGQIGYVINEEYRGNNYAVEACKLLLYIAKAHKMTKLLITNNYTNIPSRRVCEKLGARLIGSMVRLPEWSDLYSEGQRFINIFEWDLN